MEELAAVDGGDACLTTRFCITLGSRGIEYALLPWLMEREIPVMAYCPLAQAGRLRHGLMRSDAVRKTADVHPRKCFSHFCCGRKESSLYRAEHTLENTGAVKVKLDADSLALLDRTFPAPNRKTALDIV